MAKKKEKEPEAKRVIRVLVNKDQYDAILNHTEKENMFELDEILEAIKSKKKEKGG